MKAIRFDSRCLISAVFAFCAFSVALIPLSGDRVSATVGVILMMLSLCTMAFAVSQVGEFDDADNDDD